MGADELAAWRVFHNLYDFPDGYYVAQLLARVNAAGAFNLGDVIPYYKPAAPSPGDMAARLRRLME